MIMLVVVIRNGRIHGKTVSDRWNLDTMGLRKLSVSSLSTLIRVARMYGLFVIVAPGEVQPVTRDEASALGSVGLSLLNAFSLSSHVA